MIIVGEEEDLADPKVKEIVRMKIRDLNWELRVYLEGSGGSGSNSA